MCWDAIGRENLKASHHAKSGGHHRTSVSRAYYAAFDALNHILSPLEDPPKRYRTHRHQDLTNLVRRHLTGLSIKRSREFRAVITRLQKARLGADYVERLTHDDSVAQDALRDGFAVFINSRWNMVEQQQPRHLEPGEVLRLARQYLLPHQPADYRLEVLDDGLRQEDDWWYVLVRPDRDDIRAYDYYSRLAEAEISMRDQEDLNVLLVPAMPD